MAEPLTEQQMNDLRERIVKARSGVGSMPSREELLQAYNQLRGDRSLAGATKTARSKKPSSIPMNLNDLFNKPSI